MHEDATFNKLTRKSSDGEVNLLLATGVDVPIRSTASIDSPPESGLPPETGLPPRLVHRLRLV